MARTAHLRVVAVLVIVFTGIAVLVSIAVKFFVGVALTKAFALFLGLEGTLLLASTLSPPHAQMPEKPKSLLKIVRWSFTEARSLAYPITYNPVFLYGGLFLLAVSMVLATISV